MNLADIETFLTIVSSGSITQTAELLFLSQQMKQAEYSVALGEHLADQKAGILIVQALFSMDSAALFTPPLSIDKAMMSSGAQIDTFQQNKTKRIGKKPILINCLFHFCTFVTI